MSNYENSYIYEYIWIDGWNKLRSKIRVIKSELELNIDTLPNWNFDGSSTNQANSDGNTEVILKPVKKYNSFFNNTLLVLVLCETYNVDGTPHETNSRYNAKQIFDKHLFEKPWFGLEQEYFMIFSSDYKKESNNYYCGTSLGDIQRKIMIEHLKCCIDCGLNISGTNAEVSDQQWEFQIGPCLGIESGDHVTMSRFLLERIAEKYNVTISYEPKPINDINGSGCHINFSTINTRNKSDENGKSGLSYIYDYINKLKQSHCEMNEVYGENNHLRLTGKHETSSFHTFTSGIGTRNTSIRIPNETHINNCGYLEDRRPGANIDPYKATSRLFINSINLF